MPDTESGGDDGDIWPLEPSEAAADVLADPALPVAMFSTLVARTVAIAEDPWLGGSREVEPGSMWRTLPIPPGEGIPTLLERLTHSHRHSQWHDRMGRSSAG